MSPFQLIDTMKHGEMTYGSGNNFEGFISSKLGLNINTKVSDYDEWVCRKDEILHDHKIRAVDAIYGDVLKAANKMRYQAMFEQNHELVKLIGCLEDMIKEAYK